MQEHIRDLLSRFQYSEQLRETAVFRILFGGEEVSQVMEDLGIHSGYTIRSWVQLYRQKMQTGLLTLPAMKQAQKRDMAALKQRNEELEQTLQQANLLILALNTMIETAEKDGGARALKCADKKKVWHQTVIKLRENEIAKVSVGSLCRLFAGPPELCEPTSFSR
jgi:transposase